MSQICFAIWVALNFEATNAKGGAHQWNLTTQQMAQQHKVVHFRAVMHATDIEKFHNYSDMFFSPAVGFTKLSILFLVLRIFCTKKQDPFFWLLQSLNILNTIFYCIFLLIPIFLCKPREKIWLPMTPGKCMSIYSLYIASATFNILSDIAMYLIPLWKIWHLHIPRDQKLGISVIFATGSL